jgi:ubiquitin-protein ligase
VDTSRIHRELAEAQRLFATVQLYPTPDGKVYARAAFEIAVGRSYVVSVKFADNYPNEMPKVFVDAPTVASAPHMYNAGNICYLHPSMWNPGVHSLAFVLSRTAKWLSKYEVWKSKGRWPGASISH